MSKQATGELRTLADGYEARIRIPGAERKGFFLATCPGEEEARERCAAMAQIAVRLGRAGENPAEIIDVLGRLARTRAGRPWDAALAGIEVMCAGKAAKGGPLVPTFEAFAKEWTDGKLAKKYPDHVPPKDATEDERYLSKMIVPHIGQYPVNEITLDHADLVMANIPEGRSPALRRHVAQVIRRVLGLAVYPARWRKENPIPRGWLPRLGKPKAMQWVFPDEDAKHMRGDRVDGAGRVPLERRLFLGIARREGMRCGELASLRFRDVDLVRGFVTRDENKTSDPRAWALDAGVVRALKAWKDRFRPTADGDSHIFADETGVRMNVTQLAREQREDLKAVGVDRAELHANGPNRRQLREHDARASFCTAALANGRNEAWVCDRTGWRSSAMIAKYRRSARTWAEIGGGNWLPLDVAIPELSRPIAPSLPHDEKTAAAGDAATPSEPIESVGGGGEIRTPGQLAPSADFKNGHAVRGDAADHGRA